MDALKPMIAKLAEGESLSASEARAAFTALFEGAASDGQIGAFLMALRLRGETVDELVAGAETMRRFCRTVKAPDGAIDTCGTGGDGAGTYNISTAAAFVAAACGVSVAKHGNRALSSKSGSAQVLEALGVKLDIPPNGIERCIQEAGIGFMFAPNHHEAMRHVGPVRQELGVRSIFNLLGPLSNPAQVTRQLIGVYDRAWLAPLAHALKKMGARRGWVVHGADGLDELTTTDTSHIAELRDGKIRVFELTPEEAGLSRASPSALQGGAPDVNAAAMQRLFDGEQGAYRDITILNAAAALLVAERAETLMEAAEMAANAIDDGGAAGALKKLVALSNEPPA